MRCALLFLIFALAGCDNMQLRAERPVPVNAHCDPICFDSCVDGKDTGVRWQCDPNSPACWDELSEGVAMPLGDKLRVCDTRRESCARCLTNLKKRRVIQ